MVLKDIIITGDNLKKYKKLFFAAYIFVVLWLTLINREFGEIGRAHV